jgi:hypothetical protein
MADWLVSPIVILIFFAIIIFAWRWPDHKASGAA